MHHFYRCGEKKYFNGFIAQKYFRTLRKSWMSWSWKGYEEFLIENRFEWELWGKLMIPEVGTLINHTQEGMACGPVLYTVLLGRN